VAWRDDGRRGRHDRSQVLGVASARPGRTYGRPPAVVGSIRDAAERGGCRRAHRRHRPGHRGYGPHQGQRPGRARTDGRRQRRSERRTRRVVLGRTRPARAKRSSRPSTWWGGVVRRSSGAVLERSSPRSPDRRPRCFRCSSRPGSGGPSDARRRAARVTCRARCSSTRSPVYSPGRARLRCGVGP
jgi:hypothetical protein